MGLGLRRLPPEKNARAAACRHWHTRLYVSGIFSNGVWCSFSGASAHGHFCIKHVPIAAPSSACAGGVVTTELPKTSSAAMAPRSPGPGCLIIGTSLAADIRIYDTIATPP